MKSLIISIFIIQSTFALYGEDNRILYNDFSAIQKEYAKSIIYQVDKHELRGWHFQRYWKLIHKPLSQRGICENDLMANQASIRINCTGILVTPKHMLMAGNCITEHYCYNDLYYYMLNYTHSDEEPFIGKKHRENFFKCKKVIKRAFNPTTGMSFALLELDKEVDASIATPIKLSSTKNVDPTQELISMGHIQGTPVALSENTSIQDQSENFLLVSSDITAQSKGSALINKRSGELEGILIFGTRHYQAGIDNCKEPTFYKESNAQEIAIKTHVFKKYIDDLNLLNL